MRVLPETRWVPYPGPPRPPISSRRSPLPSVRAIVRALRTARRNGQIPETIVLSPDLFEQFQIPALRYLWSSPKQDAMLGVLVEVDASQKGWALRIRGPAPDGHGSA